MTVIKIRKPDDLHLHLRQGEQMGFYARETARSFARALVMPNTLPPVTDPAGMQAYKKAIETEAPGLEALMAFKLLPEMPAETVGEMKKAGAIIGKLYPAGATTNSEDGISSYRQIPGLLEAMEAEGMVLSIHGEHPEKPVLEREISYLKELEQIVRDYPKLRIVMEHLSCRESIKFLEQLPEHISGTVTTHHLMFTLDDLMGGALKPHLFCKPVVKKEEDRRALVDAVCSGHPRLFYGSDSAPHPRASKESSSCGAGAFTAPVALPLLAELFERESALDKLEDFVSRKGAEFYGLPLNSESLSLKKESWTVPALIGGSVPLMAGEEIRWKVSD
ncbi:MULTISPECIES: dihydroorotase [unclassified Oceanispirochaeta]|uniref:dihydroorotase n=1 Tax=unclassified Oceanispirochaeta TaxID=2635722 RepID=UPI000E090A87|nr:MULTISPECIES: dihydroorotase [unclassified Oceanispirochaeta]MBF9015271.1 dihydroorotase [Oceanispirochaeta sp. M2]NPD71729.1 dihydroorotase [Oceanispirochaeta sp. M1]RDG32922.1 dihydroorotase [Oceanispirochaeta sp. M1]